MISDSTQSKSATNEVPEGINLRKEAQKIDVK